METTPTLPVELLRPIVEGAAEDVSTLYALTQTCTTTHGDAEPLLYRCLKRYDWKTQIGFVKRIAYSSRLAEYVQIIHILPPYFQSDPAELQKYLSMALRHTVNLKDFRDGCYQKSLNPLLEPDLPVFKLERFSFHNESGITQLTAFLQFLLLQPGLRRLSVKSDPNITSDEIQTLHPCSPHIVPKLQFLRGSFAMIAVFLPRRKITILDWEPVCEDGKEDYSRVGPYLSRLKYLCLRKYPYSRTRLHLGYFVQYMDNLEYLDLPGFQYDEIKTIQKITTLRGLAITGLPTPNSIYPDFSLAAPVNTVFARCPHIKVVAIEVRSGYQMKGGREFQVWRLKNLYAYEQPTITLVPISDLEIHHIFELLAI